MFALQMYFHVHTNVHPRFLYKNFIFTFFLTNVAYHKTLIAVNVSVREPYT